MTLASPKFTVRVGLTELPNRLTAAQARRYGERHMPRDLRRVGFSVVLTPTSTDIHGWSGLRINYAGQRREIRR